MKVVLLGIRGKFSHVYHISCDKVEEMRSKEETQPQMIVNIIRVCVYTSINSSRPFQLYVVRYPCRVFTANLLPLLKCVTIFVYCSWCECDHLM